MSGSGGGSYEWVCVKMRMCVYTRCRQGRKSSKRIFPFTKFIRVVKSKRKPNKILDFIKILFKFTHFEG